MMVQLLFFFLIASFAKYIVNNFKKKLNYSTRNQQNSKLSFDYWNKDIKGNRKTLFNAREILQQRPHFETKIEPQLLTIESGKLQACITKSEENFARPTVLIMTFTIIGIYYKLVVNDYYKKYEQIFLTIDTGNFIIKSFDKSFY